MKEANRFNDKFFKASRTENVGHYGRVAEVVHRHFHQKTMIEVGCGMGWITLNLKAHGEDCIGFDISRWAIDNKVCDGVFQASLLDFVDGDKGYKRQIAVCSNVFAYFDKGEVKDAFRGLSNLFSEHALVTIQTKENILRSYPDCSVAKENGRRTFKSWEWWLEQAESVGLVLDKPLLADIASDPRGLIGEGTTSGKPTLYVFKH